MERLAVARTACQLLQLGGQTICRFEMELAKLLFRDFGVVPIRLYTVYEDRMGGDGERKGLHQQGYLLTLRRPTLQRVFEIACAYCMFHRTHAGGVPPLLSRY